MKKRKIAIFLVAVFLIQTLRVYDTPHLFAMSEESTGHASEVTADFTSEPTPEVTSEPTSEPTAEPTADPEAEKEKKIADFKALTVYGLKVKNRIQKKIKLSWKKVKQAKKYEVFRSKKKNKGYKKIKTVKKNSFTDKKAAKRKTYFYKVRAVSAIEKTTVKTQFSKPVKLYVEPKHPKTVIVGECFAVALRNVKNELPSTFRYVAEGGMTTYAILNKNSFYHAGRSVTPLEKAATYKPDRIIFIVGANGAGSVNPTASAKKFITMLKLMKRINKHVQFVIMSVSPWKRNSIYGRRMTTHQKRHRINAAYKKVAGKYKSMHYCPLTLKLEDGNGDLKGIYNGGDGLHWSYYCRSYMAKMLKKWLKKKLGSV